MEEKFGYFWFLLFRGYADRLFTVMIYDLLIAVGGSVYVNRLGLFMVMTVIAYRQDVS